MKVVMIGGSAGSIQVLAEILPRLKENLLLAVVIVLHRKPAAESTLTFLLNSYSNLAVSEVTDKMSLEGGKVFLAPADYHLLFESDNVMSLDVSEKINFSRPSIDVSFCSASQVYGKNVVGFLLSGANSDGVEGLLNIQRNGGTICVQDPNTAEVDYMPKQAIGQLNVNYIMSPYEMALFINKL